MENLLSKGPTPSSYNTNIGLFNNLLATVHTRLNYILIKSVGLGVGACNYDPRFTSCMAIGHNITPPFTYFTHGCI